jgi:hypothetical protein
MIFCPETRKDLFSMIPQSVGISPFPRLLNNGQILALFNRHNELIFSLQYEKGWYRDLEKAEGGFALEMIDMLNPCGDENNWRATDSSTGGTPGKPNAVAEFNPDRTGPGIKTVYIPDPKQVEVVLTEKLNPNSLEAINIYIQGISNAKIDFFDSLFYRSFNLSLPYPLSESKRYEITVGGIRDCIGNVVNPEEAKFYFYMPRKAKKGDIVINEIMFNPKPGGVDWVEIYNKSEFYIDLENMAIGTLSNGRPDYQVRITDKHLVIEPSGFLVITEDPDRLIADFPSSYRELINKVDKMPVLPDQFGNIALISVENKLMDYLSYQSNFHHKLITEDEGISLERISVTDSTNNPGNWHSASSVIGYGTPTFENSSQILPFHNPEIITLEPEIITPDADGSGDQLHIHFSTGDPGYTANVEIYSITGRPVKSLLKNRLIPTEGTLIWDGYTDKGQVPPNGIYILRFELYNLQGDYQRIKKRFVLARRI